tara:strand:+ start:850 stop:1539 length:690 start_codon:yes stop_codon:yes gene_type:complete
MAFILTAAPYLVAAGGIWSANQDRKSMENANETAQRQRAESISFLDKAIKQGRGDLFKLFPSAQKTLQAGMQGSMDVFNQAFPQQLQAFQAGNIGAQKQIIAGMQPRMNALMGQPMNYNPQITEIQQPTLQGQLPQLNSMNDLGLKAGSVLGSVPGAGWPNEAINSGALLPHKDHFHPPGSNVRVSAGQAGSYSAPGQQQQSVEQQLMNIPPEFAQQLIAEYQATQGGF